MDKSSDSDFTDEPRPYVPAEFPQPFSSLVSVDMYALSHQGHVRSNNQDHYLVLRVGRSLETVLSNLSNSQPGDLFEETAYGMVVADGLGGPAGGEVASREAIYTLLSLVLRTPDWQFRWGAREENTVMWRMTDRFRRVNEALLQEAAAQVSLVGMSTTLTAVVTHGDSLIIGHIGDSRAYLLRSGKLKRLTRDHTLAQRLIDTGIIAADDDLAHSLRNVLMQALGSRDSECLPDVRHYSLEDGDQILLCTDGLTDMVDDESIESLLTKAGSAQMACRNLIDSALTNGGKDNVTVVVAKYTFPTQAV